MIQFIIINHNYLRYQWLNSNSHEAVFSDHTFDGYRSKRF